MHLSIDQLKTMANAVRVLSVDMITRAQSGHPGMPLGFADAATVLVGEHMRFCARDPKWPARDRLVLSAGHGCALLYSLLHLCGYDDFPLTQLQQFRRLHATTAGHPEYGHGGGIELTTGPLGQGIATAVGMAIAEKLLHHTYGDILSHHTYVIVGDGCLMEGVSHEAFSLAGHLGLDKLIVLFDHNHITIDGHTQVATSDDLQARICAYGWDFFSCDGHDHAAVDAAIRQAKASDKPAFIACRTTIGYGAGAKEGTEKVHGSPLSEQEVLRLKETIGWQHTEPFEIPENIRTLWTDVSTRNQSTYAEWQRAYESFPHPSGLRKHICKDLPEQLFRACAAFKQELLSTRPCVATRKASQMVLDVLCEHTDMLLGGSADLTHSNLTLAKGQRAITSHRFSGRYIHYGVREFAMGCAMNGISVHEGFIPYGGTFLVFSDYCRSAIRSAALMKLQVIYVLTHDSIGLGEDGPTHQPIEHLASLRAMPNVYVFRPADAVETLECWQLALQCKSAPSILALSRQNLPTLRQEQPNEPGNRCTQGAYLLKSYGQDKAEIALWASGSEVQLADEVARQYHQHTGKTAAVISAPCLDLLRELPEHLHYLHNLARRHFAIEAGVKQSWEDIIPHKHFFGLHSFGASAPAPDLYDHFGLTSERILECILANFE